jgi:predicted phosphodiesterase
MRLVHLADLHVGYRQYQRLTPAGINQREADVAATFKRAIDRTIELRPDFVLIAGDVFHSVRPSNPAILHAFQQFSRLVEALPNARVVMIAGNHDTPRTAETGCILYLFKPLGITVVEGEAQRLKFPEQDVSILAVPDMASGIPALTPDPTAARNVLLLHGEVEGVLPEYARRMERAMAEITRDEIGPARWDYVALGHYHVHRAVAPNAYYAGSIDYTSADPWGEIREEREAGLYDAVRGGKGIVEWDLETATHTFHPLAVARPLIDLPRVDGTGMSGADLDAAIVERVGSSRVAIDDRVVRLVVTDVPRHLARQMDPKAVRDLKRRALHFNLDVRRPEVVRRSSSGAPGRRPSLAEVLREKLESRPVSAEIDRPAFVALGLEYLNKADATMAAASGSEPT